MLATVEPQEQTLVGASGHWICLRCARIMIPESLFPNGHLLRSRIWQGDGPSTDTLSEASGLMLCQLGNRSAACGELASRRY